MVFIIAMPSAMSCLLSIKMPVVNLPLNEKAVSKINQIVREQEIFENEYDLILHAITDMLERYRENKG